MLKIRKEQLYAVLQDDEAFVRWYKDEFLPEHLPEYYHSAIRDESRREMILQGREYARQFGLTEVPSHVHFVTMMFNIGPNFFECPGFKEALTAPAQAESEVVDRLYQVTSGDAERAMAAADDRYWWPNTIQRRNHE